MSEESYRVLAVGTRAPDFSFVDLTLWIVGAWAESTHDRGFDA
jgi:hypothetical protein